MQHTSVCVCKTVLGLANVAHSLKIASSMLLLLLWQQVFCRKTCIGMHSFLPNRKHCAAKSPGLHGLLRLTSSEHTQLICSPCSIIGCAQDAAPAQLLLLYMTRLLLDDQATQKQLMDTAVQ